MREDINVFIGTGRLTRDPDVSYAKSGLAICKMSIASNRRFKGSESTSFFDITVFGKQAEICSRYLKKGSQICVEGRLEQQSWEKDGQRRSKIEIIANSVKFMDSSRKSSPADSGQTVIEEEGMPAEHFDEDIPF